MISEGAICFSSDFSVQQKFVELQEKREAINLQIVKLKRFKKSYSEYKNSLREDADALQPINYIQSKFGDKVDGEYRQFLNILSKDLER